VNITPGSRVGPYEIVSALGAGGMGEVFRARDTNLGREVAIKVLPEAFAADAERLARFEREARVLASLNHPNIAAIYDLERTASATCLVMELAVGETLETRLAGARGVSRTMTLDDALPIAVQIASALEAAHEKGIVHRDLKPANVVVSPDGRVKVLDFGLAKAIAGDVDTDRGVQPDLTHSPTAYGGTIAGVILGTAAYMSPEQARGKPVDKRTDIWSFGCVLFEMVTGKPAFGGETLTDIVAAVVKNEPEWEELPAETPPAVRAVLRRCLKKDPTQRMHDIADARLELLESPSEPTQGPVVVRPTSNSRVPWFLTAALGMTTALLAVLLLAGRQSATPAPVVHLDLSPPPGVELVTWLTQSVCVSADGGIVGFIGVRGGARNVFVRRLAQPDTTPVLGTDGANTCFFSPDGRSMAFVPAALTLKTVSLGDGQVSTIVKGASYTTGVAWGPDGRLTYGGTGDLWQVASTGGAPRRIVGVDAAKGEILMWPTAIRGGQSLLITSLAGATGSAMRVESVTVATGERRVLVEDAAFPLYTDSGHLVFFRDGALFGAPYDAAQGRLTGPSVRLVSDVGNDVFGGAEAALSATGTLVYVSSAASVNRMMWVSREGVEHAVSDSARAFVNPRIAPDGRRIAFTDNGDLWLYDTLRETTTRMMTGDRARGNSFPLWASNGKRVIFRTRTGLRLVDADGSGRVEPIPNTTVVDFPNSMSHDGKLLVFQRQMADTSGDLYVLTLGSKDQPRPLVSTAAYEGGGQLSPDDHWLAYSSDESGRLEVYLRPFAGADRKWPVSTQGGTQPHWRGDGRELYYRSGNKMMAVDVRLSDEPTLSNPRVLFEQPYAFGQGITLANYDVSQDGQRFIMLKETGSGRINVVLNFGEELKRLAPPR
jgi:eukaryotic-like serine/threonine-protein kinase